MKLTLIGNGSMALALAKGLYQNYELEVFGRDEKKLQNFKKEAGEDNIEIKILKDNIDITDKNLVICVKPHALKDISSKLSGNANIVFSILAGTTLETLKENIDANSYIRTMPNLCAAYLKSMTTMTGDEKNKELATKIFSSIGNTLWVKSEKELDIATAIAGSGPAYLALVAESLADGGVKSGLNRADSQALVKGLFEGFAPLLDANHPGIIKDGVMSPGGTTAAGYSALEENGVRNAMIKAIEAAFERAQELGK